MYINGKAILTKDKREIHPPHEHQHVLGQYAWGDPSHVQLAVEASLKAQKEWANMPWEDRASIFFASRRFDFRTLQV